MKNLNNIIMYLIINRTTNTNTKVFGTFPVELLERLLEEGNDLIIISTYSNTIKVPFINKKFQSYETKSGYEWDFKDYSFHNELKGQC